MRIEPLFRKILIEPIQLEEHRPKGGLEVVELEDRPLRHAKVIEIGTAVAALEPGDLILVNRWSVLDVPESELCIVEEADVVGRLHDVEITEVTRARWDGADPEAEEVEQLVEAGYEGERI